MVRPNKKKVASPKVFLNAPLSDTVAQNMNIKIKKILEEEGFICILPQEILPPGTNVDPKEVLRRNVELVKKCDIVLSLLDAPGEGVIFELGLAHALGKRIVAFRSNKVCFHGKVVEGLWSKLPESRKAMTLDELRSKLKRLRANWRRSI